MPPSEIPLPGDLEAPAGIKVQRSPQRCRLYLFSPYPPIGEVIIRKNAEQDPEPGEVCRREYMWSYLAAFGWQKSGQEDVYEVGGSGWGPDLSCVLCIYGKNSFKKSVLKNPVQFHDCRHSLVALVSDDVIPSLVALEDHATVRQFPDVKKKIASPQTGQLGNVREGSRLDCK